MLPIDELACLQNALIRRDSANGFRLPIGLLRKQAHTVEQTTRRHPHKTIQERGGEREGASSTTWHWLLEGGRYTG